MDRTTKALVLAAIMAVAMSGVAGASSQWWNAADGISMISDGMTLEYGIATLKGRIKSSRTETHDVFIKAECYDSAKLDLRIGDGIEWVRGLRSGQTARYRVDVVVHSANEAWCRVTDVSVR